MEFMDLFFYCMQFLVFYFGEAIQWTTDYPQGHTTEGTGETRVFALARYLLYCLLESEGVVVGDGEEGGERTRRC